MSDRGGVQIFDELPALLHGAPALAAFASDGVDFVDSTSAQGAVYYLQIPASDPVGVASSVVQQDGGSTALAEFPYPLDLNPGNHFLHTVTSGRRLYFLASRTASSVQLVRLPIDPDTGKYGQPESPVLLPPGVSDFVISPDGESLYAIDPTTDQILLVQ